MSKSAAAPVAAAIATPASAPAPAAASPGGDDLISFAEPVAAEPAVATAATPTEEPEDKAAKMALVLDHVCQAMESLRNVIRANPGVELCCNGNFKLLFSLLKQESPRLQLLALEVINSVTVRGRWQINTQPHACKHNPRSPMHTLPLCCVCFAHAMLSVMTLCLTINNHPRILLIPPHPLPLFLTRPKPCFVIPLGFPQANKECVTSIAQSSVIVYLLFTLRTLPAGRVLCIETLHALVSNPKCIIELVQRGGLLCVPQPPLPSPLTLTHLPPSLPPFSSAPTSLHLPFSDSFPRLPFRLGPVASFYSNASLDLLDHGCASVHILFASWW